MKNVLGRLSPLCWCGLLAFILLSGCAGVTVEQATITRYVSAPRAVVMATFEREAPKLEWRRMSENVYEKTVMKEKDPILGLITVSEKPASVFRVTIEIEGRGGTSLIRALPEFLFYLPIKLAPIKMHPGSTDSNSVAAFIDRVVAQAQFDAGKSTTLK